MRVLMGTDGSVHASGAMLAASRLLEHKELEVDLLCVAPGLTIQTATTSQRKHDTYKAHLSDSSRRILDDAQRILSHAHLKTRALLEIGSPADRLLALAPNYDLTVVGAYGNHDRKQPGLGPVSSRVLQLSSANIMIGRELVNQDSFRILVALDNSAASFSALRTLRSLFDSSSFEVTLMHVIETPWVDLSRGYTTGDDADVEEVSEYGHQLERELRRIADVITQHAVQQLDQWKIAARTIIEEGDPALELSSYAEQGGYDLILCGATGTSDVRHALMGSVSLKLAWHAPCSVVIIRQDA